MAWAMIAGDSMGCHALFLAELVGRGRIKCEGGVFLKGFELSSFQERCLFLKDLRR